MSDPAKGMPCPIDGTQLVMSERSGIEIDYCPTCRGVWLDRGELDKIIERSVQQPEVQSTSQPRTRQDSSGDRYRDYNPQHGNKKRRKSFFEELFD